MNQPDLSLIRDPDLREKAEKVERGLGYDSLIRIYIAEQQKRDKAAEAQKERESALAALPREKRRRAVIREVMESSPPTPVDVRHIHSVLALCGLPYDRQPLEMREFERIQGNMAIDITAGFLRDPNGNKILQPLPFGPKARLILMHLCSEAVRQKSAKIEIAESLTGFVRDMGFSDSGGKKGPMTAFKRQLNALAACTIRMSVWNGQSAKVKAFSPIEDIDLWLPASPGERMLWPSTVTFSPTMFESLQRHALPVNTRAVRAFAGSARKLDLYFWLGWRMYNINAPLRISWEALRKQFGTGFARERDFRSQLVEEIGHLKEVFPKLPLEVCEEGILLQPSDVSVLALPAHRLLQKR
jgi:hypothetical protein